MHCTNCKKEVVEGSEFCSYCGSKINNEEKPLDKTTEQVEQKIKQKKKIGKGLIIVIICCIALIVSAVYFTIISKKVSSTDENIVQQEDTSIQGEVITVNVSNNKKETFDLQVKKEVFYKQLQEDLDIIYNQYLEDVTIDSCVINGLYNVKENEFEMINYITKYETIDGNECFLSSFRLKKEDFLVPYNVIVNNEPNMLVDNTTFNSISQAINIITEYSFNDDYVSIAITGALNSEINGNLMGKYINKQKENTTETVDTEELGNIKLTTTTDNSTKKNNLMEYLQDEEWVQDNLILKKNVFGDAIASDDQQAIKYNIINDNMIITYTRYQGSGDGMRCSILTFNDGKVNITRFEEGTNRYTDYVINKEKNILYTYYTFMGHTLYQIFGINENNIGIIGYLEMDDYVDHESGNRILKYRFNGEEIDKERYEKFKSQYIVENDNDENKFETLFRGYNFIEE